MPKLSCLQSTPEIGERMPKRDGSTCSFVRNAMFCVSLFGLASCAFDPRLTSMNDQDIRNVNDHDLCHANKSIWNNATIIAEVNRRNLNCRLIVDYDFACRGLSNVETGQCVDVTGH
jgi:hypothetical protein